MILLATITVSYIGHKLDIWKEKIRALTKLPLKKPQVPCERIAAAVGSNVFQKYFFFASEASIYLARYYLVRHTVFQRV